MPAVDQRRPSRQETSYIASFVRWLQLKKYQYEVTFSLYMLTSTEKFIFNMILFILFSLLVTAATMYLPNHVVLIYNRIWYYLHGNGNGATEVLRTSKPASVTSRLVKETAANVMRKLDQL